MSCILNIETSTNVCSVSLSQDGVCLHEEVDLQGPSHAQVLAGFVKEVVSFAELASEPIVLFPNIGRPNFADFILSQFYKFDITPNVAQVVGDAATGIALVASGFGVCFVPESAMSFGATGVKYIPLKESADVKVDISCMYMKDDKSPILEAFLKTINDFRINSSLNDT